MTPKLISDRVVRAASDEPVATIAESAAARRGFTRWLVWHGNVGAGRWAPDRDEVQGGGR